MEVNDNSSLGIPKQNLGEGHERSGATENVYGVEKLKL